MLKDPIVEELHEIRAQIAKECNYDLNAICQYFENVGKEAAKNGRKIMSPAQKERNRKLAEHPNKHIRAALKYATEHGWIVKKSSSRAHAWGVIYCSFGHNECWMSIYSTPKNPEGHARNIRKTVDRCPNY